jgi:ribonuclease E
VKVTPPGVAPSQVPAPVARPAPASATKTIFGVPTPGQAGAYTAVTQPSAAPASASAAPASVIVDTGSSKTGARKTSVPAPEVSAAPAEAVDDPAATRSGYGSAPADEAPKRPSAPAPIAAPKPAPAPAPVAAAAEKTSVTKRETAIWTYVGVGVIFGAALIGIFQLVGLLAH